MASEWGSILPRRVSSLIGESWAPLTGEKAPLTRWLVDLAFAKGNSSDQLFPLLLSCRESEYGRAFDAGQRTAVWNQKVSGCIFTSSAAWGNERRNVSWVLRSAPPPRSTGFTSSDSVRWKLGGCLWGEARKCGMAWFGDPVNLGLAEGTLNLLGLRFARLRKRKILSYLRWVVWTRINVYIAFENYCFAPQW